MTERARQRGSNRPDFGPSHVKGIVGIAIGARYVLHFFDKAGIGEITWLSAPFVTTAMLTKTSKDGSSELQIRIKYDNGTLGTKTPFELSLAPRPDGSWANAWLERCPTEPAPTAKRPREIPRRHS
ncbi:hypothetical protein HYS29_00945 [Candidatus Microgenomates bacterium]|nr:hypothetical protein [Candidatus Microgenomates bacterium]